MVQWLQSFKIKFFYIKTLSLFVQQEYEIAQLGPIYVEWNECKKRNEKGKIVHVSGN